MILQVPIEPSNSSTGYATPPPPFWQQVSGSLTISMQHAFVKLASFLPGILALLIALVIMTAVGAGLAYVLRRVLTSARFDERLGSSNVAGVSDFSPGHSPTLLASRIAFWACVVVGFLIGISAFDASYSTNGQMSSMLVPYVAHSIGALILLLGGTLVARFVSRSVLIGAVNAKLQYARILSLGVKWLVLTLTGAMVIEHLQIGGAIIDLAFGILFGGIVLTLALAVGLGSRDIVSRSLERNAERLPQLDPNPIDTLRATETTTAQIRHF